MRVRSLLVLIFVGGIAPLAGADTVPVLADSSTRTPAAETHAPAPGLGAFAIGVNSPIGWFQSDMRSIGASLFLGLSEHAAIRLNVARYENPVSLTSVWQATRIGESFGPSGTFTDAGLAWVWYPRRLWQGPTLELGALWRGRDTTIRADFADETRTDTSMYAGRAMVGWSWLVTRRVFVAVAVGGSVGLESGHETIAPNMPMTRAVSRTQLDGEGYFRIGFAYGP